MNAHMMDFQIHGDDRGSLIAIEQMRDVPFEVKRVYYIFDTLSDVRRGFHAHRELEQVLICVRGQCKIHLDDGTEKREILLSSPKSGLYLKGLIWREMYDFSEDAVLLVFASEYYDESDYIRDYGAFLEESRKNE